MDKYQKIIKLAEAAELINQVIRESTEEVAQPLQNITDSIADLADQIENQE